MGKIFTIGDIHGCISYLEDLFAKLKIDPEKDRIVFIGDYVDRGPDIKGVVEFILELKQTYQVICLIGNHERLLLDYYDYGHNKELWFANGGTSTVVSYGIETTRKGKRIDIPEAHLKFFRSLLPYYETDDYIFVHGGLKPGVPLQDQELIDLVWIRDDFIRSQYDFGKKIIFGHTPRLSGPYIDNYKIGIDTGAVYGGKLTCLELPEIKFYQVPE
jgi:serine/threonine protein phosphatase 1